MSFPPPPGFQQHPRPPSTSQSQPHSSLPPRPPPASFSSSGAPGTAGRGVNATDFGSKPPGSGYNAFTTFQPRSVAASQTFRTHSPVVSTPPASSAGFSAPSTSYNTSYLNPQHHAQQNLQPYQQSDASQYGQQQYGDSAYVYSSAPQIRNPFPLPGQDASNGTYNLGSRNFGRHGDPDLDPETEAQIAQWQSAYISKDSESSSSGTAARGAASRREGAFSATGANTGPLGVNPRIPESSAATTPSSGPQTTSTTPVPGSSSGLSDPSIPSKTVLRAGGGQTWADSTLLEWDPAHFRLFAGNLAGEVTDDSLLKAFSKYASVQKARVVRDKRTEKSKGYGFVSFSDGDDYFRAAREMQGKYIGSHPVLLRRATTEIRPVVASKGGKGGKKAGGHSSGAGGAGRAAGGKGSGGTTGKSIDAGVHKKQGKMKGGLRVLG